MRPPPVTDLSTLPVVLLMPDMAAVYRVAVSTIRHRIADGTFSPRPWQKFPYRWRREDVIADLNRSRVEPSPTPRGFKRRQKRATLETPAHTRTAS